MAQLPDSFVSKTIPDGSCRIWVGTRMPRGYGLFWDGTKQRYAHRVAYEIVCGPIPDGLEIDHLCRRPECVNPEHLEAVTHRENMRRSNSIMGFNARKTECKHGHPLDEKNTRIIKKTGQRRCRACVVIAVQQYRKRKRRGALL